MPRGYKSYGVRSYRKRYNATMTRRRRAARQQTRFRKRWSRRSGSSRRFALYRNPLNSQRQFTVLRYAQSISLDPKAEALGATGSNVWQFAANGCYDPDVTGTGHQPMYFDNFAAVYQKYRVRYSKISVTVVNHSVNTTIVGPVNTPNYSYRLFILRDGGISATNEYPADMGEMIEEGGPNVKWRFIAPSLTGKLPKLKHSVVPSKILSCSNGERDTSSLTTSNPALPVYFFVGITSADGNTDPPAVYLYVTITYYVEFFDRYTIQAQN